MKAVELLSERIPQGDDAFAELRLYRVPAPVPGSSHDFKCRFALVVRGVCVLRYDNEAGKGDHRHRGGDEVPYAFTTASGLLADFWADVDRWRASK